MESWQITGLSAMIPPLVAELNCDPVSSRPPISDEPLFAAVVHLSGERRISTS